MRFFLPAHVYNLLFFGYCLRILFKFKCIFIGWRRHIVEFTGYFRNMLETINFKSAREIPTDLYYLKLYYFFGMRTRRVDVVNSHCRVQQQNIFGRVSLQIIFKRVLVMNTCRYYEYELYKKFVYPHKFENIF